MWSCNNKYFSLQHDSSVWTLGDAPYVVLWQSRKEQMGNTPGRQARKFLEKSTLVRKEQQHHHGNLSQNLWQCSCSFFSNFLGCKTLRWNCGRIQLTVLSGPASPFPTVPVLLVPMRNTYSVTLITRTRLSPPRFVRVIMCVFLHLSNTGSVL